MSDPYVNLSDEKLMILYQDGNELAFETLYNRYRGRVYSFLSKRLAHRDNVDDVFQGIFVKFHKCRQQYRPQYSVAKWLFSICHSELIDYYRKKSRTVQLTEALDLDSIATARDRPAMEIEDFLLEESLTANEKLALRLRYEQNQEFIEISKVLNTAQSNTRKIISRAISKLKAIYGRTS